MLMEHQSNVVKDVMQKTKFRPGFCENMKNIITKKGDFAGVKMHDWHVFTKVIIMVSIFFFYLFQCILLVFSFSTICFKNETICILL